MKTIKIIDLLNKIANGEEVPEKFRYVEKTYERIDDDDIVYYICKTTGKLLLDVLDDTHDLRDDIEILDEEDEFVEINNVDYQYSQCPTFKNKEEMINIMNNNFELFHKAIRNIVENQKKIIEKLKEMK